MRAVASVGERIDHKRADFFNERASTRVVSHNSAASKSRGFSFIELEDVAESLAHADSSNDDRGRARRKRNDVVEALVVALEVIGNRSKMAGIRSRPIRQRERGLTRLRRHQGLGGATVEA
jgi:cytidylate kinase